MQIFMTGGYVNNKEGINKEALWLAYGKKCAYTGVELGLDDVTRDHIIPKSVFKPNDKNSIKIQEELRKKYALPDDFNFDGIVNIMPTSGYQNENMKKDTIFTEGNIRYFTNIAIAKASDYNKYVEVLKNRDKMAELLKLLKEFEWDIKKIGDYNQGVFDLDFKLFFDDGDITIITKDKIDEMLNKVIFAEGVKLVKYSDDRPENTRVVKSCNEYMNAAREGYFADNNWGIKFSCRLESQYNILNALKHAQPVANSHIRNYGIFSLCNIPSAFFPVVGEEDYSKYKSYAHAINHGIFKLNYISKKELSVSCEGMNHYYTEVFRADFNGDKQEEILVYSHGSIDNASYSYGGSYFITIDKDTEMFKKVDIDWN